MSVTSATDRAFKLPGIRIFSALAIAISSASFAEDDEHEKEHRREKNSESERPEGRGGRAGGESRAGRGKARGYQEIPAAVQHNVSYVNEVKPILLENCTRCHGAKKQKGDLRLDTKEGILEGGEEGKLIKPGNGEGSFLVRSISGFHVESEKIMPPKDDMLTKEEIGIIRAWIDQGAVFDGK